MFSCFKRIERGYVAEITHDFEKVPVENEIFTPHGRIILLSVSKFYISSVQLSNWCEQVSPGEPSHFDYLKQSLIVFLVMTCILLSGCTWFDMEEEDSLPKIVLKNEGTNDNGNFVVRIEETVPTVRARNIEIGFENPDGSRILFLSGGEVKGTTLDNIYSTVIGETSRDHQVVFYDLDDDQRLAGRPQRTEDVSSNLGRDFIYIHPKLGAEDLDDPEYSIEGIKLILLWRNDDPYIPDTDFQKKKDDEGAHIASITLIANTSTMDDPERENEPQESADRDNKNLFGMILLAILCVVIIVVLYPKIIKNKKKKDGNRKNPENLMDSPVKNKREGQKSSGDIAEEKKNDIEIQEEVDENENLKKEPFDDELRKLIEEKTKDLAKEINRKEIPDQM